MAKRIPLSSVGVPRVIGGKKTTVYPKIGVVFDFTADELTQLVALEKASGTQLIRKPVNEELTQTADDNKSDLSSMTVKQLTDLAAERKVDLAGATAKADILAKLEAEDL